MSSKNYILHLDGDGFFAACELLRRRDLQHMPVVVGQERGIATAMNQKAKAIGIQRGEPIFKIRRQYGNTVAVIPSHFDLYRHISAQTYAVLTAFGYSIDPYGIDENFLLVDESDPKQLSILAKRIQRELLNATGVSYSIGIGRTKCIAKLCSKYRKPYGCTVIAPHREEVFLEKIPVEKVWGVGRALAPKLMKEGIVHALMLRNMSDTHARRYGKMFLELRDELRGNTRLSFNETRAPQKSVEATRSFGFSSNERSFVLSELSRNIEIVCQRLFEATLVATHVRIFIKHKAYGRQYADSELEHPTNDPRIVLKSGLALVEKIWSTRALITATGICAYGCKPQNSLQEDLFGHLGSMTQESQKLQTALGSIKAAYGDSVIQFGSSLQSQKSRHKRRVERDKTDEYIYGLPLPYLGKVM